MNNNPVKLYLALVHHPIVNKNGALITTSVTNMDLHDIARSCRTFGFSKYFVITPIVAQQKLLDRILGYWETDKANDYNPDRQDALSFIQVIPSLEEVKSKILEMDGVEAIVATTSAQNNNPTGNCQALLEMAKKNSRPILLVLGTGWGLHPDVYKMADFQLDPIPAAHDYNHLSVRSAAAIYTSRLSSVILP